MGESQFELGHSTVVSALQDSGERHHRGYYIELVISLVKEAVTTWVTDLNIVVH